MKSKLFLLVIPLIFLLSCKKDKDNIPAPNNNNNNNQNTSQPIYYFKGNLDGEDVHFKVYDSYNSPYGYGVAWASEIGTDTGRISFGSTLTGQFTYDILTVYIGELTFTMPPGLTDSVFYDYLQPRSFPYAYITDHADDENGVQVAYEDKDGIYWSTLPDSIQAGSSFKITKVEKDRTDFTNTAIADVHMEFNCKLYNDAGDMMEIKDGEAKLYYQNNY